MDSAKTRPVRSKSSCYIKCEDDSDINPPDTPLNPQFDNSSPSSNKLLKLCYVFDGKITADHKASIQVTLASDLTKCGYRQLPQDADAEIECMELCTHGVTSSMEDCTYYDACVMIDGWIAPGKYPNVYGPSIFLGDYIRLQMRSNAADDQHALAKLASKWPKMFTTDSLSSMTTIGWGAGILVLSAGYNDESKSCHWGHLVFDEEFVARGGGLDSAFISPGRLSPSKDNGYKPKYKVLSNCSDVRIQGNIPDYKNIAAEEDQEAASQFTMRMLIADAIIHDDAWEMEKIAFESLMSPMTPDWTIQYKSRSRTIPVGKRRHSSMSEDLDIRPTKTLCTTPQSSPPPQRVSDYLGPNFKSPNTPDTQPGTSVRTFDSLNPADRVGLAPGSPTIAGARLDTSTSLIMAQRSTELQRLEKLGKYVSPSRQTPITWILEMLEGAQESEVVRATSVEVLDPSDSSLMSLIIRAELAAQDGSGTADATAIENAVCELSHRVWRNHDGSYRYLEVRKWLHALKLLQDMEMTLLFKVILARFRKFLRDSFPSYDRGFVDVNPFKSIYGHAQIHVTVQNLKASVAVNDKSGILGEICRLNLALKIIADNQAAAHA